MRTSRIVLRMAAWVMLALAACADSECPDSPIPTDDDDTNGDDDDDDTEPVPYAFLPERVEGWYDPDSEDVCNDHHLGEGLQIRIVFEEAVLELRLYLSMKYRPRGDLPAVIKLANPNCGAADPGEASLPLVAIHESHPNSVVRYHQEFRAVPLPGQPAIEYAVTDIELGTRTGCNLSEPYVKRLRGWVGPLILEQRSGAVFTDPERLLPPRLSVDRFEYDVGPMETYSHFRWCLEE